MISENCEHNTVDGDKLKSCPFCGGDVYMDVCEEYERFDTSATYLWSIVCSECEMSVTTEHGCSLEMAEWWNKRARR